MTFQFTLHGLAAGLASAAVATAGMTFHAPKAQAQELDFQCYDVVTKELILAAARDLTSNALFCIQDSMGDLSLGQDFDQTDEPVVIYASNNDGGSDFMEGMLGAALGTVIGNVINGPAGGYEPVAPDLVEPGLGSGGGLQPADPPPLAEAEVAPPAPLNVLQRQVRNNSGLRNIQLPRQAVRPHFGSIQKPQIRLPRGPVQTVRPNLRPNLGVIRKPQLKMPRPALKPGVIRTGSKRLSAPRIKPSLRTKSPLLRRIAR